MFAPRWITLIFGLLACFIYMGFTTRSVEGAIGFIVITALVGYGIEQILRIGLKFQMRNPFGIACTAAIVLFFSFLILRSGFDYSYRWLLCVFIVVIAIIFADPLSRSISWSKRCCLVALGLSLEFAIGFTLLWAGNISPDGYSYYEISQTIGSDFGHTSTVRQYVKDTDLNISFPYLFPFFIHVVDEATKLGVYSGILLDVYLTLLCAAMLCVVSRSLSGKVWSGVLTSCVLLLCTPYLGEVFSGRSIPLSLLLTLVALFFAVNMYVSKSKRTAAGFLLLGIFAGAVSVTRFDGIALTAFCALIVIAFGIGLKGKMRALGWYCLGAFIIMLPWIIYSMVNFHTLWISDNSGTAFFVKTGNPAMIRFGGEDSITIFTDPSLWFVALGEKAVTVLNSLASCSLPANILIGACVIYLLLSRIKGSFILRNEQKRVIAAVLFFYALKTVAYVLVGYSDLRYHAETVVVISLVLSSTVLSRDLVRVESVFMIFISFVFAITSFCSLYECVKTEAAFAPRNPPLKRVAVTPAWVTELEERMRLAGVDQNDRVLMLSPGQFQFGGLTGQRIIFAYPFGLNEAVVQHLFTTEDADYILIDRESGTGEFEMLKSYLSNFPIIAESGAWVLYDGHGEADHQ